MYNTIVMPNQRNKDKRFVGAWLGSKLHKSVKKSAQDKGVSVSDWVTEQLTNAAESPDALKDSPDSPSTPPVPSKQTDTSYHIKRKRKK